MIYFAATVNLIATVILGACLVHGAWTAIGGFLLTLFTGSRLYPIVLSDLRERADRNPGHKDFREKIRNMGPWEEQ